MLSALVVLAVLSVLTVLFGLPARRLNMNVPTKLWKKKKRSYVNHGARNDLFSDITRPDRAANARG